MGSEVAGVPDSVERLARIVDKVFCHHLVLDGLTGDPSVAKKEEAALGAA